MALHQTALALLVLFCTAAPKVYGCVCYVGQEPAEATGKQYGWSLAEQRPCECTEFRLGGVNMKLQIKPHEVMIGEDSRVSVNEQGQIIQSPDCREDQSGKTFDATSLCAQNTYQVNGLMELQRPTPSPMRLEFAFITSALPIVYLSPNGPGTSETLIQVVLAADYAYITERVTSSQRWRYSWTNNVNYIGVPVIMKYDYGLFQVEVQGVPDSRMTFEVTPPAQPSWFVSFRAWYAVTEISFTKPCINDFNPKFRSQ